jgi:serine/threonine protein kinase
VLQGADGVCRLLGTCEKGNRLCLVMKRYERSLADLIKSGPLSAATIRSISHALCRTLAQLHRAGVVVQDIKPQNVLLDGYDSPVLADFGIASVVSRTTQIMPTQLKGTSNYMAPEAFEPPFGAEVDVWSMGCLIVEMSTGSPPWAELNMQQIMMAVAMLKRAPDVPDTVPAAEAVRQCFAFDPKERPTASALADAFRPPADDAAGASPAELQRQQLQIDALRRENAAQRAEIAAQQAESAAQRAAHAAQMAQMEALLAQLQRELGRRYVSKADV